KAAAKRRRNMADMAEELQLPLGIGLKLDLLAGLGSISGCNRHIGPGELHANRTTNMARQMGGKRLMRPDLVLGAEAAAHKRCDDTHSVRLHAQTARYIISDCVHALRRIVKRHASIVPDCRRRRWLHRL